jgi:EmrB/QacA subfamily drug resistance transporter
MHETDTFVSLRKDFASGKTPKQKLRILVTTSLVSSLIMLDSNIVAVSLPAIGRSLGASFTQIEWVVSAYLLSYAALLLAAGAWADLKGRKRTMILGLFIFGISSAACGLAPTPLTLNLSRAVQGVGGAMLLTSALAVITHAFVGAERAKAFAVWGASLGIALTVGPIIGGLITNLFGWRWVFLVNVPACVGLIIATFAFLDESRDPDAKQLDLSGVVTFSPGLFLLIWALIDGNEKGWSTNSILSRVVGAVICFVAFVFVELHQERPMVEFSLFRQSTFTGAVFAMIGYGATAQVMVFYLPLFLQNAYGFDPLKAGLAMTPFALPMVLTPRLTTRIAQKVSGRAILTLGLVVTLIGNLLFWLMAHTHQSYQGFAFAMLVAGTGAGLLNGETVKVLGGAVSPDRAGMASGISSTTRFIGILFGVAGLGAVLSTVTGDAFMTSANAIAFHSMDISIAAKRVVSGDLLGLLSTVPKEYQEQYRAAGLSAFANGFGEAALLAAFVAAVMSLLTFRYVRSEDTAPSGDVSNEKKPCMVIDCRDPI